MGLLAYAVTPPPVLVTLGPARTVVTQNLKIGVHTRLTDEVEPWKIKKTLELVREMGAPWVVEYFPWGYIENRQGQFDWDHSDEVVDHAQTQGLTLIARLGLVPEWVRGKGTPSSLLLEEDYTQFGEFVSSFVEHYRGRVHYLVIWNEPNTNFEWGERPVDPAGYVRMLQVAYTRAKEKDPSIVILGGALAPNTAAPGATDTMNDLEYLDKMYAAGAGRWMDGLAAHAYGWKAPAGEPPDPAVVNFRRVELYRDLMARAGEAAKPVYVTEGGWNDHPRWTKAVTPAQRIEYTLRAYDLCAGWDWVRACAFWAFRYPAPAATYQDYFTFVTPDFDRKPIYFEVQQHAGAK